MHASLSFHGRHSDSSSTSLSNETMHLGLCPHNTGVNSDLNSVSHFIEFRMLKVLSVLVIIYFYTVAKEE